LYFLNGENHIVEAQEFEAASDVEALNWAEGRRDHRAKELWSGARRIQSWRANPTPEIREENLSFGIFWGHESVSKGIAG
jgi:hypothetical protein